MDVGTLLLIAILILLILHMAGVAFT